MIKIAQSNRYQKQRKISITVRNDRIQSENVSDRDVINARSASANKNSKSEQVGPKISKGHKGQAARQSNVRNAQADHHIVCSAKSLITSIKSGRLGSNKNKSKQKTPERDMESDEDLNRSRNKIEDDCAMHDEVDHEDFPDGVDVDVNPSDDDYQEVDPEQDESQDSNDSTDSDNDQTDQRSVKSVQSNNSMNSSNDDEIFFKDNLTNKFNSSSQDRRRLPVQQQAELDRNDPRVQKLLRELMDEQKANEATHLNKTDRGKIKTSETPLRKGTKISARGIRDNEGTILKSPSDTTIYAPALNKVTSNNNSPIMIAKQHINRDKNDNGLIDQISDFVEKVRIETSRSTKNDTSRSASKSQPIYGEEEPSTSSSSHTRKDNSRVCDEEGNTQQHPRERSLSRVDRMVLEAEKFKAAIIPPKGKDVEMVSVERDELKNLLTLVRTKYEEDVDDEFFHITCHIDKNLKDKIGRGEFVDLECLLPRTRSQVVAGGPGEDEIEVVRKDGASYRIPISSSATTRENKITNVRKWEQAFRVYAAIYSEYNPQRSAEIWQYVHIINSAAASFIWENVNYYDIVFRELMEARPHRSWAKTYTQMWNIAMRDHIVKQNFTNASSAATGGGQTASATTKTNTKFGDWRDRCCWKFNKGTCKKWDCKWDHRCKKCGSYSHQKNQCPKNKGTNYGSGQGSTSTSFSSRKY